MEKFDIFDNRAPEEIDSSTIFFSKVCYWVGILMLAFQQYVAFGGYYILYIETSHQGNEGLISVMLLIVPHIIEVWITIKQYKRKKWDKLFKHISVLYAVVIGVIYIVDAVMYPSSMENSEFTIIMLFFVFVSMALFNSLFMMFAFRWITKYQNIIRKRKKAAEDEMLRKID